jgi:hypothetical protein
LFGRCSTAVQQDAALQCSLAGAAHDAGQLLCLPLAPSGGESKVSSLACCRWYQHSSVSSCSRLLVSSSWRWCSALSLGRSLSSEGVVLPSLSEGVSSAHLGFLPPPPPARRRELCRRSGRLCSSARWRRWSRLSWRCSRRLFFIVVLLLSFESAASRGLSGRVPRAWCHRPWTRKIHFPRLARVLCSSVRCAAFLSLSPLL